jgi:peptidoglycan/xylan/chitin deacetylase (PgdA/CDA1 family)
MRKRDLMANLLDRSGATEMFLGIKRSAPVTWLPIVTFHRVTDRDTGSPYLFDEEVVDASPAEFERHIRTISKYFQPISVDQAIQATNGAPLPKNPILVTFDDGYRDNFEIALPILKRYGVRAVFFIATHYLSKRRTFWWDRVNFILKTSKRLRVELTYPKPMNIELGAASQRLRSIHSVLRVIKSHVGLDLERFIEHVAEAAEVRWTEDLDTQVAEAMLMTWDQVRELRAQGMDVQSHTRTHRVLQTLDASELRTELEGSRQDLEEQLGERVSAISYPVGHRLADREDVRRSLRRAGYKIGFTNATGTHRVTNFDPYDVSRISMGFGTSDSVFRTMLAAAPFFG